MISAVPTVNLNAQGYPDVDVNPLIGSVILAGGVPWVSSGHSWELLSDGRLTADSSGVCTISNQSHVTVKAASTQSAIIDENPPTTQVGIREGIEELLSGLRSKKNSLPFDDHWKTSGQIYSEVIKDLTLLLYNNN